MTDATFRFTDNTIRSPLESAVSIQGPHTIDHLWFDGLTVSGATLVADVRPGARGTATFTRVAGASLWRNASGSSFGLDHP